MNYKRKNVIAYLGSILLLVLVLVASIACWGSPLVDLIIENRTDQVLTVILDDGLVGKVRPGDKITRKNLDISFHEYVIEAKNAQGEIVFSQSYVFEDFQKIDGGVYKVVIPPLQNK